MLSAVMQEGGLLLMAPQHRLSLLLKWHELRSAAASSACAVLDDMAALPYMDILDESDELLHHRCVIV
jgi:hypothetical protein